MTAPALADRRLRYLHEISTLLARFTGIDETLPRVVEVAARALPVRTAVLVVDTTEGLRSHVWKTDAAPPACMESALAHAQTAYAWFATGSARIERVSSPPSVRPLSSTTFPTLEDEVSVSPQPYVALPLVVRRAQVFGILQVESAAGLAEADVLFLDALTNQVAIAIDRQMTSDAYEARVRAQLAFTRAITGSLGEGVIATDAEGCISFVNPAAEQILGWTERAIMGRPAEEVLRIRSAESSDFDTIECPLVRALATTNRVASDDHAFVASDGRVVPVSYIAAPILGARATSGAVLAFRDVLAVKRSERAQRLLAECGAALGGSLDPEAMIRALVDCLVPRFADALFLDDTDGQCPATLAAELVVPLRARTRSFGSLTFVMGHSERTFAEVDVTIAEEIGRRTATALENARLHAQTEKAVRDRQEILAVVSHDLRSPLNTIVMAVGALRERARRSDPQEEEARPLEIIARAASRMTRMTRDLLDVSSIEANQLAVDRSPVRVVAIVNDLMEDLRATAESREIELTVTQADPSLVAFCDHDRILQVLTNLVGNAIKFTGPRGRIDVAVEADEGFVRFVVCDTGTGIAPDLLPQVFDRHRQAAETASQGRGLGLFITRGIIEAHGAHIRVASEPGVGTAFEFCLPRIAARPLVKTASSDDAETAMGVDRVGDIGHR